MDDGYLIDENKLAVIWRKHRVTLSEMVEVYENPDAAHFERGFKDRSMTRGATKSGRILSVIWSDEEEGYVRRLVTAFEYKE